MELYGQSFEVAKKFYLGNTLGDGGGVVDCILTVFSKNKKWIGFNN